MGASAPGMVDGMASGRTPHKHVASLAGLVAAVLVCAPPTASAERCGHAAVQPRDTEDLRIATAATRCLVNDLRGDRGLQAVDLDPRLERAARQHAHDMVQRRYFSHVSRGGRTMLDRISATGYLSRARRWRIGEVLAWGTGRLSTPARAVRAWLQSRPHRRLLLDPAFRDIGVGIALGAPSEQPLPGATYAIDLGHRR